MMRRDFSKRADTKKRSPHWKTPSQRTRIRRAYNVRGYGYTVMRKCDLAIRDFTAAIQLGPQFADASNNRGYAYQNRGVAWFVKGEFDRAAKDLNDALARQPESASAYYNRGLVFMSTGDFDRALSILESAICRQPDLADAYFLRGDVFRARRRFRQAIDEYTKSLEHRAPFPLARLRRGESYFETEDYDAAISDFRMLIEGDPNLQEARRYLDLARAAGGGLPAQ